MVSLGCPKNTVDSERVLGDLVASGYDLTPDEEDAEIIIVNTCGFIESAKKESVEAILEMARKKNRRKLQATHRDWLFGRASHSRASR